MRLIKGLREDDAHAIADSVARHGPFDSIDALRRASGVRIAVLRRLAAADAFGSMGLDRQQALWRVRTLQDEQLPMFDECDGVRPPPERDRPHVPLPEVPPLKKVVHDYDAMHLSLKAHPLSFVRDRLAEQKVTEAKDLADGKRFPNGRRVKVAGLVLVRQRPGTARGLIFMTIEDETGVANLVVRPQIFEKHRRIARHGIAIVAHGTVERQGQVVHIQVTSFEALDDHLAALASRSRNFH